MDAREQGSRSCFLDLGDPLVAAVCRRKARGVLCRSRITGVRINAGSMRAFSMRWPSL
jgi:hypothetical protein